jgi:hypothetical protein
MTIVKSANLPALVLELGEIMTSDEALLATPQDRIAVTYNREANRVKIAGTFSYSGDFAAGAVSILPTSYLPDPDLDLTATPVSALAAGNITAALVAATVKLSSLENTKIAAGSTLPSGVGAVWSASSQNDTFSIDVDLAFVRSLDTAGKPVFTVTNHVA